MRQRVGVDTERGYVHLCILHDLIDVRKIHSGAGFGDISVSFQDGKSVIEDFDSLGVSIPGYTEVSAKIQNGCVRTWDIFHFVCKSCRDFVV